MTSPLAPVLALWGTSNGVGKSIVTFGLSRYLTSLGYRVRVVKPIAVSCGAVHHPRFERRIDVHDINYATATATSHDLISVPVCLTPLDTRVRADVFNATFEAHLWLDGVDRGVGSIAHPWSWPFDLVDVVTTALDRAREGADVVLLEGSGSPADSSPITRLANGLDMDADATMGLIIVDSMSGNPFAQVHGLLDFMESSVPVLGYVLNRVIGAMPMADERFEQLHPAVVRLGHINTYHGEGQIPNLDIPGATGDLDKLRVSSWFDLVAANVTRSLDLRALRHFVDGTDRELERA